MSSSSVKFIQEVLSRSKVQVAGVEGAAAKTVVMMLNETMRSRRCRCYRRRSKRPEKSHPEVFGCRAVRAQKQTRRRQCRGKAQLRLTMCALKIQDIAEVIRSNASSSQKQVVELQEQTHVSMSKATKDHLVCWCGQARNRFNVGPALLVVLSFTSTAEAGASGDLKA